MRAAAAPAPAARPRRTRRTERCPPAVRSVVARWQSLVLSWACVNERATTLGRYRLGRLLGRGGMAEVYEAQAVGAAGVVKTVCVKRILPQYARDRRFVEMFVREAEVSMALAHGNIAQVFDFGRDEGELYLAMELVRGASLDALLRRLRRTGYLLPLPLALLVAQEVLEGLHHAHTAVDARGRPLRIVHRDVSPHNVLLSWEGEVKIVDFGIAVARGRAEETGAVPGKVAYMAPEQAAGKEVDPRADVYGVGAVLYEMLAGAAPLAGDTRQMLYALSAGRIPDLAVRAPWVPPELLEIVRRAMAPDPSARFASALAMYQALAEYAHRAGSAGSGKELAQLLGGVLGNHDQPDPKRPTPPSPELRAVLEPWRRDRLAAQARPARRRGLLLSAGALLVVSLVVGLALWLARPAMREVVVESVPPGAAIFLDDRETGETTPARLEGLERDRPYALRLQLEGYEPAAQILYPGQRQVVQSLRPILTGPAPAPAPEPVDRPESAAERRAARRRGLRDTILEKGG
ncbi:MAG: PEGA domain-containing protein, partial [Deltaproteobacteria bacterium]